MSGSLKIRLPKPTSDQPTRHPDLPRMRQSKRRVVSDDESEGGNRTREPESPPNKRARRSPTIPDDEEIDVDGVEIQDTRFFPEVADELVRSPPKKTKASRHEEESSRQPSKRSRKRTAKVVWSSDEDFADVVGNGDMDAEDEDFEPDHQLRGVKDKGKSAVPARANGIIKVKGGKKAKKDDKDIIFRDERKISMSSTVAGTKGSSVPLIRRPLGKDKEDTRDGATTSTASPPPTTTVNTPAASTPAPSSAVDSELPSATVPPTASTSSLPPIPKKKLPTIKKNKPAGGSAMSTPSAPSHPKKAVEKASTSSSAGEKKPVVTEGEPVNDGLADLLGKKKVTQEKPEFDLRNADVYNELFKSAGGSAPRAGSNRKEKEMERRKELDKMREEARAKRLEEAKKSFSLTSAPEKVGRFEDLLKERKSSAAFPNLLCGKVREVWEAARRDRERKKKEEVLPEVQR